MFDYRIADQYMISIKGFFDNISKFRDSFSLSQLFYLDALGIKEDMFYNFTEEEKLEFLCDFFLSSSNFNFDFDFDSLEDFDSYEDMFVIFSGLFDPNNLGNELVNDHDNFYNHHSQISEVVNIPRSRKFFFEKFDSYMLGDMICYHFNIGL